MAEIAKDYFIKPNHTGKKWQIYAHLFDADTKQGRYVVVSQHRIYEVAKRKLGKLMEGTHV